MNETVVNSNALNHDALSHDELIKDNSKSSVQNDSSEIIEVEVAFATPEKQLIKALEVEKGTTADQAIGLSEIGAEFETFDVLAMPIGIFSKVVERDYVLQAFDRVEIYRPLIADPKEVRKKRAAEAKAKKDAEREQEKLIKAQEKAARREG